MEQSGIATDESLKKRSKDPKRSINGEALIYLTNLNHLLIKEVETKILLRLLGHNAIASRNRQLD